ncbi:hypothetical protein SAMN02910418_00478 [Bowdeniella nasicola]|uniref:Uncharacterized protein n=1 Tax=Bowdeniella nasicola TaxID=208480 RepID=A0A1H3WSH7_9ACTO|nr:hypothetical protein SAMN02910418_00478 [Bowdeniella nasicola]
MSKLRSLRATLLALTFFALGGTAVASATVDISPATNGLILTRHVVNKTSTPNFIDTAKEIGRCQVGTTGGTCTIQSGKTVTRTIQLTTGVTRW